MALRWLPEFLIRSTQRSTPYGPRAEHGAATRGPARPGGDTFLAADGRVSTQCSPDVKVPSSTANRGRNAAASTPSGVGGGREEREGENKKKKRLEGTYVMCCTADDEGRSTGRAGRCAASEGGKEKGWKGNRVARQAVYELISL